MSEASEVPTKTYAREIMEQEQLAASVLSGMVMGNLQNGQMPPTDIFKWFGTIVAYHLAQAELDQLNGDARDPEALAALVKGYVQALDLVFAITAKNKMLVFEQELRSQLRARKLHLPTHFDSTYGGILP